MFHNALIEVFKDKTLKDSKVKILKIINPDQIKTCKIRSLSVRVEAEIKKVVLTKIEYGVRFLISVAKDFVEAGTHIDSYIEDYKLKFEINKKSVNLGKFKISPLLMKGSKIFQSD